MRAGQRIGSGQTMHYVLGLTGGIASGKSTAAGYFRAAGVPVWDADEAVARLYRNNRDVIREIATICPQAAATGVVDRDVLRERLREEPSLLEDVERVVHPRVADDRRTFIAEASESGHTLVVCEVPLLFETRGEDFCDGVLVMVTTPEERERRALARDGMTKDVLDVILARQVEDDDRLSRADFVIESVSHEHVEKEVRSLINLITRSVAGQTHENAGQ